MQDYDVALKLLLQKSAARMMRELAGTAIAKWLDVELPKVQNLRLDLLAETVDGNLVQIELQSTNDPAMAVRMAEYHLGVYRLCGRFPKQVVLYIGGPKLRMSGQLRSPTMSFRYRVVDIRSLDGERLLESEDVGDNVIAILARLRDHKRAIREIMKRIAVLSSPERETALETATDSGWIEAFGRIRRAGSTEDADSHRYSGKQSVGTQAPEGYAGGA